MTFTCEEAAPQSSSPLLSTAGGRISHLGLMAHENWPVEKGLVGCLGRKAAHPEGWIMSALGGAGLQEDGLGNTLHAALVHFCAHILFGGFSAPSCLGHSSAWAGRDLRVGERSPPSQSEHSGFNSCSPRTLRPGAGTSLQWPPRVHLKREAAGTHRSTHTHTLWGSAAN